MRSPMMLQITATLALLIATITAHDLAEVEAAQGQVRSDHVRSNSSTGDLWKRAGGDPTFNAATLRYVRKGELLLEMLEQPAGKEQQSHWMHYADLEKYGWTLQSRKYDYQQTGTAFMTRSNEEIFEAYRLSKDADDNVEVVWTNSKAVQLGGHEYGASNGRYINVFKPRMIFATDNYSPAHNGAMQSPPVTGNRVTPLSHWSDIVFLQWQHFCKNDPRKMTKLVGIVRDDVVNYDAEMTILDALRVHSGSHDANIDRQPFNQGTWLDMKSQSGKAVLGTVSGASVAYFLAQHRVELGMLTVKRVKVYKPNDHTDKALLFEFAPVESQ